MIALIGRLVVPLAFVVYVLLYYLNIRHLPIAAGLLPTIMLGLVGVLLLWDLADETMQWRRKEHAHWREELREARTKLTERGYRTLGIMALTAVWLYVGMNRLGFYVSTTIFVVAGLVLLGEKRWWLIGVLTVTAVGVTYVVFTAWLSLRLPTGMFI